jgi:hypothetical protein
MLFALVAAPRSGTHMLRRAVSALPGLTFHGEVLNPALAGEVAPPHPTIWTWGRQSGVNVGQRPQPTQVRAFIEGLRPAGGHASGVDLKYWTWTQQGSAVGEAALSQVDKVVHLVRRDLVRAVVSELLRKHRTHLAAHDARFHVGNLAAFDKAVLTRATEIRAFRRRMARATIPVHEVIYEDLLAADTGQGGAIADGPARALCAFLGRPMPDSGLLAGRGRENPRRLHDRVDNYPALLAHYDAALRPGLTRLGLLP